MGSDDYETAAEAALATAAELPPLGIGAGTVVDGAIIDKNCRIGRNARVVNDTGVDCSDETPEAVIRDRIVCVQKGAILPDNWRM
jgi:glucose-1-phosphate adenylyltransferase